MPLLPDSVSVYGFISRDSGHVILQRAAREDLFQSTRESWRGSFQKSSGLADYTRTDPHSLRAGG